MRRLDVLLQRLGEVNLKLKPSKCVLLQRQVSFLGHIVSGQGVATDPKKLKLVNEWPTPVNLRQLRGFLGLSGYYRRFVKGYAEITRPLNQLTKKDQPYVWTEECEEAFRKLKSALASPPILSLPTEDGVFILDTDASQYSIGSVLSQVQDGMEKVIAYGGRTLGRNEVNYCITRKELLAVVHFTRMYRQYLLGRKFTIRTDHVALSWLQRTPQLIGQNARWLEQLGEYDYVIEHRRGHSHGNADAISRHPCLRKPGCTACHPELGEIMCAAVTEPLEERAQCDTPEDMLGWSVEDIGKAQRSDREIGFIINLLERSTDKPDWSMVEGQSSKVKSIWHEWDRLALVDGLLFRRWTGLNGEPNRRQVFLPEEYRSDFIKKAHSGATGGHLGRKKTEQQVSARAYWPGWRTDVAAEVMKCEPCAQYHRDKAPRQTLLQPFSAGEPFEVISVDITGKHPKSTKGNEYIVTVMDIFSKWGEAIPVRVHTAPVVAKVLMDHVFSRFGMPRRLLTDQGKEFESELFRELCVHMEIEKIRTSPYRPSTNGCVERFHRTLNAMIGKVVQHDQRNWDEKLPSIMAAYRAARHESTGYSPNFIMFGRENRAPVDIVLGDIPQEEQHYYSYNEYVAQMQERWRECYAAAREHLEVAAERRKKDYDIKVKMRKFNVGDWVYYFYPRRYVKRSPKWTRNYDGPFLVVDIFPPSDYVIQRSKRSTPQVVHGDKLKFCHGETPRSWLQGQSPEDEGDMPSESSFEAASQPLGQSSAAAPKERAPLSRRKAARKKRIRPQEEDMTEECQRSKRDRRVPKKFTDYVL